MKKNRGRPKAFDENEVLYLAMNYFWEHGYDSTNLENLLEAMTIKKSSFYATFKSKEEVFSKAISLYREESLLALNKLKDDIGPKNTLLGLVAMVVDEFRQTGSVKGCLIVNSSKECYKTHSGLSKQLIHEFAYMMTIFKQYIDEAKDKGEITNPLQTDLLAGRFASSLNGMVVMIQTGADEDFIDDLVLSIQELLY